MIIPIYRKEMEIRAKGFPPEKPGAHGVGEFY
jgi:hypothetical protein